MLCCWMSCSTKMFWRLVMPSYSGSRSPRRKIHPPNNTASDPRKLKYSQCKQLYNLPLLAYLPISNSCTCCKQIKMISNSGFSQQCFWTLKVFWDTAVGHRASSSWHSKDCSAFIFQVKEINLFFPHSATLPTHHIPNYTWTAPLTHQLPSSFPHSN
jgi:hypothetical protein